MLAGPLFRRARPSSRRPPNRRSPCKTRLPSGEPSPAVRSPPPSSPSPPRPGRLGRSGRRGRASIPPTWTGPPPRAAPSTSTRDGGWMKRNPDPARVPELGHVQRARRAEIASSQHQILERAAKNTSAAKGSDEQKIGDFYASCMDEAAIEAQGIKPLQPELDRIDGDAQRRWSCRPRSRGSRRRASTRCSVSGRSRTARRAPNVIATAAQGGLGLPDRDYYTKTDDAVEEDARAVPRARREDVRADGRGRGAGRGRRRGRSWRSRRGSREASMTRVERRDPDATYNRMDARRS